MKWPELNSEMAALRGFKAEFDVRQQDVPKDGAYKIEMPADVKVPEGMEIKVGADHPMAKPVMEWAKKHNMTQTGVNELIAIQANYEIQRGNEFKAALVEERGKLGEQGTARIEAVKTALTGRLGDRAKALISGMVSAEQVEAYEALLRSTIASPPIPNNGNAGKPDYSAMSPLERLHYAHTKKAA